MRLEILPSLAIPDGEISFTTARSAGPGGQHVNKVNSRVMLEFDLQASTSLTESQKRRLKKALGSRINQRGVLRLQSQRYRSQSANRADLIEKFTLLLKTGLRPVKSRIPTKVPKGVREQRLQTKKHRGQLKRIRQTSERFEDS